MVGDEIEKCLQSLLIAESGGDFRDQRIFKAKAELNAFRQLLTAAIKQTTPSPFLQSSIGKLKQLEANTYA